MPYPDQVDIFSDKLNKKQDSSLYAVEEELSVTEGVYNGRLAHDNIVNSSIRVYTGSQLTGDEITNFIVSIPSETPWRRLIKVFAEVSVVYVTYETPGDTVEADDVNELQAGLSATQTEVDRYKGANDAAVEAIDHRLTVAETGKAEIMYVDAQLLSKADKAATYTKFETEQLFQDLIDAAPDALNTLKEIADALNNDPDFAATMTTQLASKVDKIAGKGLSAEDYTSAEKMKLAGIETGANNYVHPGTHPAGMITQDASNRFVTDTEKAAWNAKVDNSEVTAAATAGKLLKLNASAQLPASITGNAGGNAATASRLETARTIALSGDASGSILFDGSAGVTIPVEVADDSHNHVISNVDGLQAALDAKELQTHKGIANGYAGLDAAGKVPIAQLPAGLPAAGGDADTLDGHPASDFMPKGPITWGRLKGV